MNEIEIWGGVECSVNRVRDRWHDQMELSGHAHRLGDLDLIAELGIRTLRYPVLWERTAPDSPLRRHWQWADERLERLRGLAIMPIVGLLHHGSGPRYTDLLAANFADELARFAGDVAARYPWVTRYTPINEPLTTARFSALYGHWYPHHQDDSSFARAIVNQCRAIALSMTAIRRINPSAELVQTEDLGTTHSTVHMAYQKDFDNERRWLTWDLLCGRVDHQHPMRAYLRHCGISTVELQWFEDNPCPPQVIGINHYVTSDRYLDERITPYPSMSHGGNTIERYADVEAVRVLARNYDGWMVIEQAAKRYALPVALTEVHIGCTREEQLRWFHDAQTAARAARSAGSAIIAVTAWALFGSYNWDKLLTRKGNYEPGAFDVRSAPPRPTAIARHIRNVAMSAHPQDPPFTCGGWWQRPGKIIYGGPQRWSGSHDSHEHFPRPVLICGNGGALGRVFETACRMRNLPYIALSQGEMENSGSAAVASVCDEWSPWVIVNTAGYVNVDAAKRRSAQCFRDNVEGTRSLATVAHDYDIPLLTCSSDLTLDGTLCVRTAVFLYAGDGSDFLSAALRALRSGEPYLTLDDVTVSPTYVPDLVNACLDLLIDGCTGIVHRVNRPDADLGRCHCPLLVA